MRPFHYSPVSGMPTLCIIRVQLALSLIHSRVEFDQVLAHRFCPLLLVLFPGSLQFTQVVCIAQGVKAKQIGVVRLPVIVTQHADKLGEDIDLIHRFSASTFVRKIIGIFEVGGTVQPMPLSIDIEACFIHVQQSAVRELILYPAVEFVQLLVGLAVEVMNRSSTKRDK